MDTKDLQRVFQRAARKATIELGADDDFATGISAGEIDSIGGMDKAVALVTDGPSGTWTQITEILGDAATGEVRRLLEDAIRYELVRLTEIAERERYT